MKIVLIRHGESLWNLENRFTGWTDVDLDDEGKYEAAHAAHILRDEGFVFDIVYTSVLKRAIHTAWIICDFMNLAWIPCIKDWRLNERHYGALQGKNKSETVKEFGLEQTTKWRRSYDIPPPALDETDPRHPKHDAKYATLQSVPSTECLVDTEKRVVQIWYEQIVPQMLAGKSILIAAHGNSLRALVKHLDNLTAEQVIDLNIPTGIPFVYEFFDDGSKQRYYLANPADVEKQINRVKNQAK